MRIVQRKVISVSNDIQERINENNTNADINEGHGVNLYALQTTWNVTVANVRKQKRFTQEVKTATEQIERIKERIAAGAGSCVTAQQANILMKRIGFALEQLPWNKPTRILVKRHAELCV